MPIFNPGAGSTLTIDLTEIEDRLTAVETENTEQSSAIAQLQPVDLTPLETRLTALELENTEQDAAIAQLEPPDLTPIETRLTAVEQANSQQNTALGDLDSRVDALEAQPSGTTFAKSPVSATTSNLAAQASGAIAISLGKTFLLFVASSNGPARIRLYSSEAYRLADLSRAATVEATGEHGLIFEGITTASNLDIDLAPIVCGSSLNGSVVGTITNLSNAAQAITVTFSRLLLEA